MISFEDKIMRKCYMLTKPLINTIGLHMQSFSHSVFKLKCIYFMYKMQCLEK